MTSRSHGNVDLVGGGASAAGQSAAAAAAAADAADAAAEAEAAAIAGRSRLHGHPRHVKGQSRPAGRYERSSALSDTSEAPSIASHVRRVRVPSQASDVDQVQMAFDWITKESFSLFFSFTAVPRRPFHASAGQRRKGLGRRRGRAGRRTQRRKVLHKILPYSF